MNKKSVSKQKTKFSKTSDSISEESTESSLNLIRLIIQRFELNDPSYPNYYIVGFKLVCDLNQRESYLETEIKLDDCKDKSDNEICFIAYKNLESKIELVKKELLLKKFIVGSEFVPPK